jgi:beta-fructofuranosidase
LFYIFQDPALPAKGHSWGHISSADLLHWHYHPTALAPAAGDPDVGIFSGCALLDKEGTPTIVYLGVKAGICIATSKDPNLEVWEKSPHNPVIHIPGKNEPESAQYTVHDPHVWLEGDTYYAALNGQVLVEEGNHPAPTGDRRGLDTLYLFQSSDLISWEFKGRLYDPNPEWTEPGEDCACPDFFLLGDSHVLLCISHTRGCRYYVGKYQDAAFIPEYHRRMNWPGGTLFAPESMLDAQGRRIFWAWVLDRRSDEVAERSGWSGIMSLPRILTLGPDKQLRIEPVPELQQLRGTHWQYTNSAIPADRELVLEEVTGDSLELSLEIDPGTAESVALFVRRSKNASERTVVRYDRVHDTVSIDVSDASHDGSISYSGYCTRAPEDDPPVFVQTAPFVLSEDESLRLHVFLDRSVLEVFVNNRQALTQRIYPSKPDSLGVSLMSSGSAAQLRQLDVWEMQPANSW